MKKKLSGIIFSFVLLLFITVTSFADVDLSGMSFQELMDLQSQLTSALWNSDGWQSVVVPVGVYKVGKDIPAGTWSISSDGKYSYIKLCKNFSGGETSGYMVTQQLSDSPVNLTCVDGNYIEIVSGPAVFETATNLGFKFSSVEPTGSVEPNIVESFTGLVNEPKNEKSDSNATTGEINALSSAKSYLQFMNFSYQGIMEQLSYDGYSAEECKYAADNCGADWREQAKEAAQIYLSMLPYSYKGLVEQLQYEGYSDDDCKYAVDNLGANWNNQAARAGENYLSFMAFSKEGLIEQLQFDGFTYDQAVYGAEYNGY